MTIAQEEDDLVWKITQLNDPTGTAVREKQPKGAVRLSEAQKDQAVLTYQQTIQRAFQEVSDALIAYDKDQEFRKQ
jgi:hypothetical protein